ncbi:TonB-dependent receptor [Neptunitalea chrysea]|uniref:TonB-dependent receptor n=1 Tax=Neptunitalea chrysea TaxID=1647581 RepID=A0A9W6B437_9FLAO|nr:TonB-dependent receptor [Neptunitalea chrysea]GLB52166.1 TonB-dependent receptor [Neptunitalea chrysea]
MRKYLLIFISILCAQSLYSQADSTKISIQLKQNTIKEAISKIEAKSDYHFFYQDNWTDIDSLKYTKNYNNTVKFILADLLDKTNLNYFIKDNNIVLTQNRRIYSKLPTNFFVDDTTSSQNEQEEDSFIKPVFIANVAEEEPKTKINNVITTKTEFIGKESNNNKNAYYTLSGIITDGKTNDPIPNVLVRTPDNKHTSVTGLSGKYAIKLPSGVNNIEITSVGFKTIKSEIILYNNGTRDFVLSESITELDEVVVSTSKSEEIRKEIAGVTVIDVKDVKNIPMVLGERDIVKVATIMPGVKTVGEGSAGFNVRGGKSDQNLFLLDNGVIYNPFHFFGFFSALNPYTIASANIYKGNIPAQYGGRLSSVFDIQTKNGNVNKLEGEGGIGPVTSTLMLSMPIKKERSSLTIGGRATYSDWILKSLDSDELNNSSASFYDVILKYYDHINDNNTVKATGYYSHDAYNITYDSLYTYRNAMFSVEWNHKFNNKHSGSLIVTHSNYDLNIDFEQGGADDFEYGYSLNETMVKLKMDYDLNDKHSFIYGISSKLYNTDPGYLDPKGGENSNMDPLDVEDEKALESAAFISDNYKINDKLSFIAGLRFSMFNVLGPSTQRIYEDNMPKNDATVSETITYDDNEFIKTYTGLEIRASLNYDITDDLSAKLSYNKNNQYIHLLSSNTTQSPTDTWKLSDLNIKPQSAQMVSLGFYKELKNNTYEVSLEGYYKKMDDILDYKVGAELVLNENIETEIFQGEGKAYGVEFLLKKKEGDLNGWIGYTYSRAFLRSNSTYSEEIINNNEYFPANFDKPHDFSLVLNYKFSRRYSLSANFIYQTGRPITFPAGAFQFGNSEYAFYSDRNQYRIPDYYRLDLGINIEGNHKIQKFSHSFWNISVYNVLGRNNPYSVFFVTEDGNIEAYKTTIFSIPVPTITYNFKF